MTTVVGWWTLVSWKQIYDDGREMAPFGDDVIGRLSYGEGGDFTVIISRKERPNFETGGQWNAEDSEKADAYGAMLAYFGRYEFDGEKRIMVSSPKVATYDLQPQMSAPEITTAICNEMYENEPDLICLNFANTDMVGHTGDYAAILKAAETVDGCTKTVVEKGLELGYSFIIIADHGNSDYALNPDGSPNTAHSLNPVPVIVLDDNVKSVKNGTLRDVAPTILDLMGINQPKEMTGSSLVTK